MSSPSEIKTSPALVLASYEIVRQKVDPLRSGVVQIVVQDARVTQIARTEKTSLPGAREACE